MLEEMETKSYGRTQRSEAHNSSVWVQIPPPALPTMGPAQTASPLQSLVFLLVKENNSCCTKWPTKITWKALAIGSYIEEI